MTPNLTVAVARLAAYTQLAIRCPNLRSQPRHGSLLLFMARPIWRIRNFINTYCACMGKQLYVYIIIKQHSNNIITALETLSACTPSWWLLFSCFCHSSSCVARQGSTTKRNLSTITGWEEHQHEAPAGDMSTTNQHNVKSWCPQKIALWPYGFDWFWLWLEYVAICCNMFLALSIICWAPVRQDTLSAERWQLWWCVQHVVAPQRHWCSPKNPSSCWNGCRPNHQGPQKPDGSRLRLEMLLLWSTCWYPQIRVG